MDSTSEAMKEVAIPQKTEMPMSHIYAYEYGWMDR